MEIDKLSLADLKAAYDFVLIDLKDLETASRSKNINPEDIPAYKEVKAVEHGLYHQLLNITRSLH
ncbi:hypothetical protein [Flavobacterium subsaxonicum]|uniref:Uncharacterized protein n=1 Tax=Flavobacterium subsaxonicum WB 4.1-42 = DSM 21790 TaxID=1121898 RepID=A0A0A2MSP0_9FLAO|nr:hypothetical protein [Flavobacterium subsaxonicum]KGO91240.1 hypothetical protein Q766_18970 [Flavobacterium subsaxonicum WB 4.1-42 = DSM 21790]